MSLANPKILIVGLGYIGLPTAAVLASRGYQVVGVDVIPMVVEGINRGEVHIVEPELASLVRGSVANGCFRATLQPEPADIYLIAVPTPFKDDHKPNLCYIRNAAKSIAPHLQSGNLIILESTSPVGTTESFSAWLEEERSDLAFPRGKNSLVDINIAYCPERVLPGRIISELVENDRVLGGLTPQCAVRARKFYEAFVRGQCFETDARTAELTKLTENSFRDVNIAFANELSKICDELDINVWDLIKLANRHPRVNVLKPGPGVGGHCIAVDPWFIVDSAPESARLIRIAREVNDSKPDWIVEKISLAVEHAQRGLDRKVVVACLGLAFKANISDLRESPSLKIVAELSEMGLSIRLLVVEPHVQVLPNSLSENDLVELVELECALNEADIVVLLVDHAEFSSVKRESLKGKSVIDTRGVWL